MRISKRHAGFTLIELLIVVTIISILAGIAIPSYRQHVMKVKRVEAKTELTDAAQRLQRCYTRYYVFNNAACTLSPATYLTPPSGYYQVTSTINAQTFTLTATPQGPQANDTKCKNFGLNERGVQTVTGTLLPKDCW